MDTGGPSLDLKEENEREEHSRVSLSNDTLESDNEDEKEDHGHPQEPYTPAEERAVVKKFDRRLVLFIALLYMLSFLDRSSKSALHLLYRELS